jgi:hypothetical protein
MQVPGGYESGEHSRDRLAKISDESGRHFAREVAQFRKYLAKLATFFAIDFIDRSCFLVQNQPIAGCMRAPCDQLMVHARTSEEHKWQIGAPGSA